MAITTIPTSGFWGPIAGLINANYAEGWELHAGDNYTSGAPFVVIEGVQSQLLNNGATAQDTTQRPAQGAIYNTGTSLITPNEEGDCYSLRVEIKAFTSSNSGAFAISLDISPLHDGTNIIARVTQPMIKGIGLANVQTYTGSIPLFTLGTFAANGAAILIESIDGTTSIYDVGFFIQKTYAAR